MAHFQTVGIDTVLGRRWHH